MVQPLTATGPSTIRCMVLVSPFLLFIAMVLLIRFLLINSLKGYNTFYKQYQREKRADENGELFIEVTIEDIEESNELLKDILLRKSDELSGSCRDYLQHINQYLQDNQQNKFTNREIRKHLKLEPTKQKRFTKTLLESYYIKRTQGSKAKGYEYEIVSPDEYNQLQSKISGVLSENLEKIKQSLAIKEPKKKRA